MKAQKLFGMLAIASAFAFTSCSSNEDFVQSAEQTESTVTFTAALPSDLISRAASGVDNGTGLTETIFGDGTKATTLYYAVYTYNEEGNTLVLTNYGNEGDAAYVNDNVQFNNLTASVKFTLANGTPYKFVFWAQSPEAEQYSFVPATGDLKIDYTKTKCNDENADAFFASVNYTFSSSTGHSVTLTRPFAQLNVGLTDYARAKELGMDLAETSMSVFKVATQFNLITGKLPESNGDNLDKYTDALFTYNVTPAKQVNAGPFPAKENGEYVDAEYEAMVYVLATEKAYDMQFNYMSTTGVEKAYGFFSIPLAPNHRTNIYGGLLLTEQNWVITINKNFIDPDYNETTEDFIEM